MIENSHFNCLCGLKRKILSFDIKMSCVLNWYLKIIVLKKNIKVLIWIDYMQGELNISSTYRFMLSVSYIEELNISSLCGTRV